MGGGIVTANYHSLSCKLWELGSNDQRGEGTVKRFPSWKWEAAWSWLEGFPCWVGGLVLCPSFFTITYMRHRGSRQAEAELGVDICPLPWEM